MNNTLKIGVIFLLGVTLLSGCDMLATPVVNYLEEEVFIDYPYIEESLEEVWKRVSAFKYSTLKASYWKSPREFEKDRNGDCEDFAIWMIYHLGDKAEFVAIHRNTDLEGLKHAIVYYNGLYIEPQIHGKTYNRENFELVYTLSYDTVMKISTNFFTK